MSAFALKFLSAYLLMPILAVIFCFVAGLLAKKSKLLSNKKLIFFILLVSILLAVPGLFGFVDYWFMPYIYISLSLLYLILGWYNIKWLRHFWPDVEKKPFFAGFFVHFLMMFVGAAFFSLIFNLCNELKYGLWACTCLSTFIFPALFAQTYKKYMEIPLEIYKIWKYSEHIDLSSFELMDYNKLLVMELEVFKKTEDTIPSKIKAKAPDNMAFGVWFQKFLMDYNVKFPLNPIEIKEIEATKENEIFGWIFYIKRSFFHPRKYIDYELTIKENKIKEKNTIVARRINESITRENNATNEADDSYVVTV